MSSHRPVLSDFIDAWNAGDDRASSTTWRGCRTGRARRAGRAITDWLRSRRRRRTPSARARRSGRARCPRCLRGRGERAGLWPGCASSRPRGLAGVPRRRVRDASDSARTSDRTVACLALESGELEPRACRAAPRRLGDASAQRRDLRALRCSGASLRSGPRPAALFRADAADEAVRSRHRAAEPRRAARPRPHRWTSSTGCSPEARTREQPVHRHPRSRCRPPRSLRSAAASSEASSARRQIGSASIAASPSSRGA